MDKRITIEQAANLLNSGEMLALGGFTLYRRPMSFVRALIRRYQNTGEPKGLTLLAFTAGFESDLLLGAGMVSRIRTCYFGLEIFGLAPMFTYLSNRGAVEVIEETEASLACGLRAQMANIGFIPARGWLGTDLPKLRPDVRTVKDPYSGEELVAFPAIHPDLAVIHALQGDTHGNAVIGGNKGVDLDLAMTARKVVVTAEEIVDKLDQADLVSPIISHITPAPGGASPSSCHPLYPLEGNILLKYTEMVSDPVSFQKFLEMWLASS